MTRDEKIEATLRAPLGSYILATDSRVIRSNGWYQLITPSAKTTSLNEIIISDISDKDATAVIDSTCKEYETLGIPLKWCVGPWTRPLDTAARLENLGFTARSAVGMFCAVDDFNVETPSGVTVEKLSKTNAHEYVETFASGWGTEFPNNLRQKLLSTLLLSIDSIEREFFLARQGSIAVGTASYFRSSSQVAYLTGGNVVSSHRSKGIYRALLQARLQRLKELDFDLATTHARSNTSAPILKRLGFETAFEYAIYEKP